MTKIKLCGLSRLCDIETANALQPAFVGFVFASKSRRYVTPEKAAELKTMLSPEIQAVGVFVNETADKVAELLNRNIIDMAQLHGDEDEAYMSHLRTLTDKPLIRAFRISKKQDIDNAVNCTAEHILLDSGAGTGTVFDWELLKGIGRPYFLAGGLDCSNVEKAVKFLHPYGVDVSSGIETDGFKDKHKMAEFVAAVRKEDKI